MDAARGRRGRRGARGGPGPGGSGGDLGAGPGAFEAVTRQMVETVGEELREIRSRVDNLVWMIAGAILLDTALRVMGA